MFIVIFHLKSKLARFNVNFRKLIIVFRSNRKLINFLIKYKNLKRVNKIKIKGLHRKSPRIHNFN